MTGGQDRGADPPPSVAYGDNPDVVRPGVQVPKALINLCESCGTYYLGSLNQCPMCGLDWRAEL